MATEKIELTVREAVPDDAKELLTVLNQVRQETDFLTMDETDVNVSIEAQKIYLDNLYESDNNVLFVAFANKKMVGTISVHADNHYRIRHIGEIGISILKDYWGCGIGSILFEEMSTWAKNSGIIRRLELTVQQRNEKAIHMYERLGFQTEAIMARGAVDKDGNFLNVHLMSKMVD